jgi:apolipoprotein N-acyltransferase
MRNLKTILIGLAAFVLTSIGFTPVLGIVAGVLVGRKASVAQGSGPRAEHARWWIDNFFVTGFCCAMVWVVCLVVVGGVASAVGPAGGVLLIPAIAAAFFTARSTWRESLPPAGPAITAT